MVGLRVGRTLRRAVVMVSVMAAGVAVAGVSAASGPAVSIRGITSVRLDRHFNYVVSGTATTDANHLVAWEQYVKGGGCASTFAGESSRALVQPPAKYQTTLWLNTSVSGKFSLTAQLGAQQLGVHGVCVYLINLSTGHTFAESGRFWKVHR